MLDSYGIKAELTASPRVGFHKYTFRKLKKPISLLILPIKSSEISTILW
jgi:putative alpha-1,2-mannosidase